MFENNPLTIPLAYILVLVLCMASLGVFFGMRWLSRDLYGKPRVLFYELFGLMLLVDLVWSVLEYTGHSWRPVAFGANLFWYAACLVICWRWLEICLRSLAVDRLARFLPPVVRKLPIAAAVLLLVASWWTGWAIDTTPAGSYRRGPHLWLVYAAVYFYLFSAVAASLVASWSTQDVTKRRYALSFAMVTAPMVITTYLQYATGFAFFFIGVIITVAIYDFDVQRKAMEVLAATDKARHDAFTMMSHDIRTPLTAIIGLAELLQDDVSAESRRRMHQALLTSSRTLLQLVNDVLDVGRLEAGKLEIRPEPTGLAALVDSVLQVFAGLAKEKDLTLVSEVAEGWTCFVDPQRIRQILFNLIGNAVKFTDRGRICVSAAQEDGRLRLSVSDTGCGIAPDDQRKLANPYAQVGRHKGHVGTGLGLSICKRLAGLMKGTLEIESEIGRGSTFSVVIPCRCEKAGTPKAAAVAAPTERPARRILMVDDAPLNLKVMSAMLKKLGQTDITLASDGQEALACLQADPGRFDLVLTDLQMPKMDGDELVRRIRADARLAHLPVHVITADVQAQTDCADAGFTGIVIKPVTIAKLGQLL